MSGDVNENGMNWWGQCVDCGAEPHNHDHDSPHFGRHKPGCPRAHPPARDRMRRRPENDR